MGKIAELTNPAAWDGWVSSRPPVVQVLCRRYPPDSLFLMKPHGHRLTLVSYSEKGTVTADVSGLWNFVTFERQVLDVVPADLEECDLPPVEELTGALLTTKSAVNSYCEVLRADMGVRGPNHS